MRPRHILQLVGSPTDDFHRELSEMYAVGCANAFFGQGLYRFSFAHISPNGAWCFPESLSLSDRRSAEKHATADALAIIASMDVDCGLPQLFCLRGMTECRAIFGILDIPFIGNNPLADGLIGKQSAHAQYSLGMWSQRTRSASSYKVIVFIRLYSTALLSCSGQASRF